MQGDLRAAVSCLVGALIRKTEGDVPADADIALDILREVCNFNANPADWQNRLHELERVGHTAIGWTHGSTVGQGLATVQGEVLEVLVACYFHLRGNGDANFPAVDWIEDYDCQEVLLSGARRDEHLLHLFRADPDSQVDIFRKIIHEFMVNDRGIDVSLFFSRKPSRQGPGTRLVFIQCKATADPASQYPGNASNIIDTVNQISAEVEQSGANVVYEIEAWLLSNFDHPHPRFNNILQSHGRKPFFARWANPQLTICDARQMIPLMRSQGADASRGYLQAWSYNGREDEQERFSTYRLRSLQQQIMQDARIKEFTEISRGNRNEDAFFRGQSPYIFDQPDGFGKQVRGQLIAPCGLGKTVLSAHLTLMQGARKVIFVCPLITLVHQTVIEYSNVLSDYEEDGKRILVSVKSLCSKYCDRMKDVHNVGHFRDPVAATKWLFDESTPEMLKVLVTTQASVFNTSNGLKAVLDKSEKNMTACLLILDESHTLVGSMQSRSKKVPSCHKLRAWSKLAMTATPKIHPAHNRSGDDLNGFWGYVSNERSNSGHGGGAEYNAEDFACQNDPQGLFGPLIQAMSLGEALNAHLVAGIDPIFIKPEVDSDAWLRLETSAGITRRLAGWGSLRCTQESCEFCRERSTDRYKVNQKENYADSEDHVSARLELVTRTIQVLSHVLYRVARGEIHKIVAYAKGGERAKLVGDVCHYLSDRFKNELESRNPVFIGKVLVGEPDITSEQELARAICNLDAFHKNSDIVVSSWQYSDVSRKIERFRRARCAMLANFKILEMGFDVPTVDAVVLLDPIKSIGRWVQIVGRGCRLVSKGHFEAYNAVHDSFQTDIPRAMGTQKGPFKEGQKLSCKVFLPWIANDDVRERFVLLLRSMFAINPSRRDTVDEAIREFRHMNDLIYGAGASDIHADLANLYVSQATEDRGGSSTDLGDDEEPDAYLPTEIDEEATSTIFHLLLETHLTPGDVDHDERSAVVLHRSAALGRLDIIERLIRVDHELNIDTLDSKKEKTALMVAAENGHTDVVCALIERFGANKDFYRWEKTPLILAADQGHTETVEKLIKLGADVGTPRSGRTALMRAVEKGYLETVNTLIATGMANVDYKNGHGRTALALAVQGGHDDVLASLIIQGRARIEADSDDGRKALLLVAQGGHIDAVNALIEKHRVYTEVADEVGATPLMKAAENGHIDTVSALITIHMANVDAVDAEGKTALMYAAIEGKTGTVDALIGRHGAILEAVDEDRRTALMLAAEKGHTATVNELVGVHMASVDAVDAEGKTALMYAATEGKTDTVQALVKHGAIVEAVDQDRLTALMYAVQNGHIETMNALITRHGASVEAVDAEGKTALIHAVEWDQIDALNALITIHRANVDAADAEGKTALIHAVEGTFPNAASVLITRGRATIEAHNENSRKALLLVSQGGYTDAVNTLIIRHSIAVEVVDEDRRTALMLAAEKGHTATVNELVGVHMASVDAVDAEGKTALMYAATEGKTDTVQALVKHGAIVEAVDQDRLTALMYAVQNGHIETMNALITRHGASVEAVDAEGKTALMHAALNGHTDTVNALITTHGASVEAAEEEGRVALMFAAASGNIHTVNALIQRHKANIEATDLHDRTSLMYAVQNGHTDIVNTLLTKHANVNAVDAEGKTALMHAAILKEVYLVDFLLPLATRAHAQSALSFLHIQHLKELLKLRGLRMGGNKRILIERLLQSL
ncbi:hypothetical protein M9434_002775 [Picochlorum sp. BPE23]|nr:hypothetical protein M9434_002775 [Picochlorum sp. BPE23]